jgi:hypothetical protein
MITAHFSYYWLLVPLVIGLGLWIKRVAARDTGGYGAGMETLFKSAIALVIFFVVLVAMLLFNLWTT